MGEVIKVNFGQQEQNNSNKFVMEVVLNRPDLIENAIEGVRSRLRGEIHTENIGTVAVGDRICSNVRFEFDNKRDIITFMKRYNNFINDNETLAFNFGGMVDINDERYVMVSELSKYGIDFNDLSAKGVQVYSGFLSFKDSQVNDSYITTDDFKRLRA